MKTTFTITLCTVAMLTACQPGKPSAPAAEDTAKQETVEVQATEPTEQVPVYNTSDAQTFGLQGHVQHIGINCYNTYDSEGELKEGNMIGSSEMTFDAWGHVTRDEWGNEYGYDADGNYYRGNHIYTTIKRDKAGRLQQYNDVEPNADNAENQKLTFSYDKSGRLVTIEQGGWSGHWTEKRHYEGNNIFPSTEETTADYEGGGTSVTTTTYTYTRIDNQGNWIERTAVTSRTEKEDDPESENGEKITITEALTIEKRAITYYEDM